MPGKRCGVESCGNTHEKPFLVDSFDVQIHVLPGGAVLDIHVEGRSGPILALDTLKNPGFPQILKASVPVGCE
jgi:hypothetical protein